MKQILAKHSPSRVLLLPEHTVAVQLGYSVTSLIQLRKEGIINPIRPGVIVLYSEEQVRQILHILEIKQCRLLCASVLASQL